MGSEIKQSQDVSQAKQSHDNLGSANSDFPFIDATDFLKQHNNIVSDSSQGHDFSKREKTADASEQSSSDEKNIKHLSQGHAAARKIIFRQLSASQKTRYQLEERLRAESIDDSIIAEELDQCVAEGYINDQYFANEWVRQRSKTRSLGNAVLKQELLNKGVNEEYIYRALEQRDISEYDVAQELIDKKLKTVKTPLSYDEKQKYKRRWHGLLMRKGIPQSIAVSVISKALQSLHIE